MSAASLSPTVSRRSTLLAGLGVILGVTSRPALAVAGNQVAHPMIGHWLAVTPLSPAHVVFEPGGAVLMAWPHSRTSTSDLPTPSPPGSGNR